MLYAIKFNVTVNLKTFWILGTTKQDLIMAMLRANLLRFKMTSKCLLPQIRCTSILD